MEFLPGKSVISCLLERGRGGVGGFRKFAEEGICKSSVARPSNDRGPSRTGPANDMKNDNVL